LPIQNADAGNFPSLDYKWDDENSFAASAGCNSGGGSYRDKFSGNITPTDRYKNINSGGLPWESKNGYVSISSACLLCQKAYANISIIRNTIESAVEFSASKIHLKTPNETVKSFFYEWFNRIGLVKLVDNFFREYYRSGNVFIYKFIGQMDAEKFGQMKSVFGSRDPKLPIRYIILNPAQVYLDGGIGEKTGNWMKVLSTFEIERLKNPLTTEDKQIFSSLPLETRQALKKGASGPDLYIPLDTSRLLFAFYKKQDYEPMAIPMIYPVLNDIEYKLELKKMDMALSRTVEQVILLITTGQKNDEFNKGGMNPQNLINLQNIFKNQTIGRVLVADYTTQGEWLIPDIGTILGAEKYKQVDADIKEGLQSILGGSDEKFANAQIKAKVFIERMKEGQKVFLSSFLIPEMKAICKSMGFRNMPEVEFESIDLADPAVMARIYTQLLQLGALDPAETFEAIKSGILPDKESNVLRQKEYKKNRDDGLYYPLVGGSQEKDGEGSAAQSGRPLGTNTPKANKKVGPIGSKGSKEEGFGALKIAEISVKADNFKDVVFSSIKKHFKVKGDLNEAQIFAAEALAKAIIANEKPEKWTESKAKEYLKDFKGIDPAIGNELSDLAVKYDVTEWQAAILRHCKM
jgi:hypothetical protein